MFHGVCHDCHQLGGVLLVARIAQAPMLQVQGHLLQGFGVFQFRGGFEPTSGSGFVPGATLAGPEHVREREHRGRMAQRGGTFKTALGTPGIARFAVAIAITAAKLISGNRL